MYVPFLAILEQHFNKFKNATAYLIISWFAVASCLINIHPSSDTVLYMEVVFPHICKKQVHRIALGWLWLVTDLL
jgi:hypothetical protein